MSCLIRTKKRHQYYIKTHDGETVLFQWYKLFIFNSERSEIFSLHLRGGDEGMQKAANCLSALDFFENWRLFKASKKIVKRFLKRCLLTTLFRTWSRKTWIKKFFLCFTYSIFKQESFFIFLTLFLQNIDSTKDVSVQSRCHTIEHFLNLFAYKLI